MSSSHPRVLDYKGLKAFTAAHVREEVLAHMLSSGLSNRRLARLANVPYTTVLAVTGPGADVKISTIARLAIGLRCRIQDLLPSELPINADAT